MIMVFNDAHMLQWPENHFVLHQRLGKRFSIWNNLLRAQESGHTIHIFGLQGHMKGLVGPSILTHRLDRLKQELFGTSFQWEGNNL